jgi:predicted O-linked N-acetylglucosamine transferase (SPINDLY family)
MTESIGSTANLGAEPGQRLTPASASGDAVALQWQRLRLAPDQAGLWLDLAQAYAADGMDWQAGIAASQALLLDPGLLGRFQALGIANWQDEAATEVAAGAVTSRRAARLSLQPTQGLAAALPALRLLEAELQGRMGDARGQFATLQQALAAHADLRSGLTPGAGSELARSQASKLACALASSLALSALYTGELAAAELAALHSRLCAPLQVAAPPLMRFDNPRSTDRRLRIGLVVQALHPAIQSFGLPWIERIDRHGFELLLYQSGDFHSADREALQACADRFLEVTSLDDEELQQTIVADGVDLLIDLSGHHPGNRLGLFARRAAPVQLSFLGYPHSTGLASIDWWVGDEVVSPADHAPLFCEGIAQLPGSFLAWSPDQDQALPAPRHSKAAVVFGSFNEAIQLSPPCIMLWARVLRAVPGSQLMLSARSLGDEAVQAWFKAQFKAQGLAPERLTIYGHCGSARMAQVHGEIDIALDPTPFNGSASTLQALWMGVPVVTLAGAHAASRLGASLLRAMGQPDWVAEDEAAYVATAVRLARDAATLRQGRAGLREQLASSALCDIDGYARNVEALLRRMWAQHCAGGGPRLLTGLPARLRPASPAGITGNPHGAAPARSSR